MRNRYRLTPFVVDSGLNCFYEDFGVWRIREFFADRGTDARMIVDNDARDLSTKQKFDKEFLGIKFEIKTDRLWGTTGFVYIEILALSHTQADYYLIQAFGRGFFIPVPLLREFVDGMPTKSGGDKMRSEGARLTEENLIELSETII